MGTPARIGAAIGDELKITRVNYDGDPESMLTVLGLLIQRDGIEIVATTLTDSAEWRELDPTALIPTEREDLLTVIGYGTAYTDGTRIKPDEPADEEFAYFLHQAAGVPLVSVKVGAEEPYLWAVGDPIPPRER